MRNTSRAQRRRVRRVVGQKRMWQRREIGSERRPRPAQAVKRDTDMEWVGSIFGGHAEPRASQGAPCSPPPPHVGAGLRWMSVRLRTITPPPPPPPQQQQQDGQRGRWRTSEGVAAGVSSECIRRSTTGPGCPLHAQQQASDVSA